MPAVSNYNILRDLFIIFKFKFKWQHEKRRG